MLAWERYLQMSITTKSHMIEDHSNQQRNFSGIGDLTEDFGERNHQYESKADKRLSGIRNFAQREKIKSIEEVKAKDPKVFFKVEEIICKRKQTISMARLNKHKSTRAEKR